MHFTTLAAAFLLSAAQAANVQVVSVGKNPVNQKTGLQYWPENIKAQPGDMVQFQFLAGNHTVTQSNFDNPCVPISSVNASATTIKSGFQPVAASPGKAPVFTVMVNDTKPIWIYCGQGQHCQNGMAMVINENTGANATRSLANYKKMAASLSTGGSTGGSTYSPSGSNTTTSTPAASAPASSGTQPPVGSGAGLSLASSSIEASKVLLLLGAGFMLF